MTVCFGLHRPKRKMRQTFYKNKNFVIFRLNSVKAPRPEG